MKSLPSGANAIAVGLATLVTIRVSAKPEGSVAPVATGASPSASAARRPARSEAPKGERIRSVQNGVSILLFVPGSG